MASDLRSYLYLVFATDQNTYHTLNIYYSDLVPPVSPVAAPRPHFPGADGHRGDSPRRVGDERDLASALGIEWDNANGSRATSGESLARTVLDQQATSQAHHSSDPAELQ